MLNAVKFLPAVNGLTFNAISCCRTAMGVGQRALSLSAHMGGGPPPHLWLRGGWRHHASFSGYTRYYWDVAATWNGWFLIEPSE